MKGVDFCVSFVKDMSIWGEKQW